MSTIIFSPHSYYRKTVIVIIALFFISGCKNFIHDSNQDQLKSRITGTVGMSSGVLILRDSFGQDKEYPINSDGSFDVTTVPGKYDLFLRTSDNKLVLVKKSVILEDYITINIINVSLVPIPQILSVKVSTIYHDSAIVEWETDIESDGRVDYGPTPSYGYSAFTQYGLRKHHRVQLNGLNSETLYHFRVVSTRHGLDEVQNFSRNFEFVTSKK